MKKSSIRNLMIATGVVALGGFVISKVVTSKKQCVIDKGEEETIKRAKELDSKVDNPRKYYILGYIKKKNSTEE